MDIQCELCPRGCLIKPGQSGDCRIRVNLDGKLLAVTYGFPCSMHVDPVEKKPLFHFMPGTRTFSMATVGCTMHCKNCQNWEISQSPPHLVDAYQVSPEQLVQMAIRYECPSISYTYTDPAAYYEYALDCSIKAREAGLKNILVTAGYINRKPYRQLCRYTDAATIDVKAMSDKFYRDVCGSTLAPVLDTVVSTKEMGVELEVSNLVIPTLNDSDAMLTAFVKWVKENLGRDTPLHFLKFVPYYLMRNLPPTSEETMGRARDIAKAAGMEYVYVGNILNEQWTCTFCPGCGGELVRRHNMVMMENHLSAGKCPKCAKKIYGVWK